MPDPYRQFRFKVKVGDYEGGFSEVTVFDFLLQFKIS